MSGRRRVLQLLAVGQDALAGQLGRHAKALQRLQVRAHVLEGLNRRRIDGVRRRGLRIGARCRKRHCQQAEHQNRS